MGSSGFGVCQQNASSHTGALFVEPGRSWKCPAHPAGNPRLGSETTRRLVDLGWPRGEIRRQQSKGLCKSQPGTLVSVMSYGRQVLVFVDNKSERNPNSQTRSPSLLPGGGRDHLSILFCRWAFSKKGMAPCNLEDSKNPKLKGHCIIRVVGLGLGLKVQRVPIQKGIML